MDKASNTMAKKLKNNFARYNAAIEDTRNRIKQLKAEQDTGSPKGSPHPTESELLANQSDDGSWKGR